VHINHQKKIVQNALMILSDVSTHINKTLRAWAHYTQLNIQQQPLIQFQHDQRGFVSIQEVTVRQRPMPPGCTKKKINKDFVHLRNHESLQIAHYTQVKNT
jgi:hypothetical protein